MFEQVGQWAEQTAVQVSRRQFLGRFGGLAVGVATAASGLLALNTIAEAGRKPVVCSTNSWFVCTNRTVGSPCGENGKCAVAKGTVNDCFCHEGRGRPEPHS